MWILISQLAFMVVYCNKVDGVLPNDDTLAATLVRLGKQSVAVNKLKEMLDADDSTPGATEAKVVVMEALIKKNGGDFLLALLTVDEINDIFTNTIGVSPTEDVSGLELGQMCNTSTPCTVLNSECKESVCSCKDNYTQTGKKCDSNLIDAVGRTLKSESKHIQGLKENLRVLQSSLHYLNGSIGDKNKDIHTLKSTIKKLNTTNLELSDELTDLKEETEDLHVSHNETLYRMNHTIAKTNETLKSQDKVITHLENTVKNLTTSINTSNETNEELSTALKGLRGNHSELKLENDDLATQISDLEKELKNLHRECPSRFTRIGLFCYSIHREPVNQAQAVERCAAKSTSDYTVQLASLKTKEEELTFRDYIMNTFSGYSQLHMWVNLKRSGGTYKWGDGTSLNFTPVWHDSSYRGPCGIILGKYYGGKWNSLPCTETGSYMGYICKVVTWTA